MPRDENTLAQMLDAARMIQNYVQGVTEAAFYEDVKTQDAVIRRLEILGEASGRLSEGLKSHHPEQPWHKMKAMRNVLIHAYDSVLLPYVWEAANQDIPLLLAFLEPLVSE